MVASVLCALAAKCDGVWLELSVESASAPSAPLLALASDVICLLLQSWTLPDLIAIVSTCQTMRALFAETMVVARDAHSDLNRLCRKFCDARTPLDPSVAGDGVHQRIVAHFADKWAASWRPHLRFGVGGKKVVCGFTRRLLMDEDEELLDTFDWSSVRLDADDLVVAASALPHSLPLLVDSAHRTTHCGYKHLFLSSNPLGDAAIAALASALPSLPRLETLDLQDCLLGDAGATTLARALRKGAAGHPTVQRSSLRRLCLGANPIGEVGCIELAAAMQSCLPMLSILQLGDTDVGDAGAEALAHALDVGAMPEGVQLWLASTRVTPSGRARVMLAASPRTRLRVCW